MNPARRVSASRRLKVGGVNGPGSMFERLGGFTEARSIEGVDKFRENAIGGLSSVFNAIENEIPLDILLEFPSVDDADVVNALVSVLNRRLDPHGVGYEVVEYDPVQPGGSTVAIR